MKKVLCVVITLLMITAFCGCAKTEIKQKQKPVRESATDVDTTMSYQNALDMIQQPEDFVKTSVTVSGKCSVHGDAAGGNDHYFCKIEDDDGCCEEVEFLLKDSYAFPDDYPQPGDNITVTGKYASYENCGYTCYRIENAEITVN